MKIKRLEVKNFLGIKEFALEPSEHFNIFIGPTRTGKTSVLDAIEKNLQNTGVRTELISHGADEATLFVETDTGITSDRRLRREGSDYFSVKDKGVKVNSPQSFINQLISGDIFRPLEFINLDAKEQAKIILNMIHMDYSADDIAEWFGIREVLDGVVLSKHILQILKDIEDRYYNLREAINREKRALEAQIEGIKSELPRNYDGNEWKDLKTQEYYDRVKEARDINEKILEMKNLRENFENIIKGIEADAQKEKQAIEEDYRQTVEKIKSDIETLNQTIRHHSKEFEEWEKYKQIKLQEEEQRLKEEIERLKKESEQKKLDIACYYDSRKSQEQERIAKLKVDIAIKEKEIPAIEKQKEIELESVDKQTQEKIKSQKDLLGQAGKYLEENEPIDIEPLQQEADRVANMKEYLREWDRMQNIITQKNEKEKLSAECTRIIEIARRKPLELLQIHRPPIDGISIDSEGRIRIDFGNGPTLLDGLSGGEMLEVALKIAASRIGELKVICLDEFQKLNPSEQKKVAEFCRERDLQAFITITADGEPGKFEIKEEL